MLLFWCFLSFIQSVNQSINQSLTKMHHLLPSIEILIAIDFLIVFDMYE